MAILLPILLALLVGQETPPAAADPVDDGERLTRVVNASHVSQCMRSMVGFRNVPVRCTVDQDGALQDCELLTSNRTVLRHSDRFLCMAGGIRVYLPDGSPAVGRTVRLNLNGSSPLSDDPRPELRSSGSD